MLGTSPVAFPSEMSHEEIVDADISNRQQQTFDFFQLRFRILFGEARKFSTERDEIILARDF